ncbi:MAG: alpha/beta fold hydrolase [Nocardioidaceae bacterium]
MESFHCIVYDVRGAGASTAPLLREGYHLRHLLTDLVAVLDELAADRRVHLVGHDWGSVQLWDAVLRESSDARLTGRIASYTSISGPALQHVSAFSEAARRGDWRRMREGLKQLMRSWYVFAFQVPVLPEAAIKVGTRRLLAAGRLSRFGPTLTDDAVHGLELYRANVRHVEHIPGGPRTTLPVQLVVPLRDSFVTPAVTGEVGRFVPRLTRVEIDAGHWVPLTSPTLLATLIADFVHSHE